MREVVHVRWNMASVNQGELCVGISALTINFMWPLTMRCPPISFAIIGWFDSYFLKSATNEEFKNSVFITEQRIIYTYRSHSR
jgi:hypothetical protein